MGADTKGARTYVSITLIGIAALLTSLNCFDKLSIYCGAGLLVPITGFSNAMVSPAMEYKSEGHILGIGTKMFTIAGPVIVYGIVSSIIYGVILTVIQFLGKGH
jgi:stage V sporulation protein AC